jgi:hypothetical protein
MSTSIGDIAANVGKGLFAGVAGTAVMTVSSTLEMKLSGRGASQTPAEAAEKVLKVEPEDEGAEARFSNLVHWGYGTVWGAEQVVLPALDVSAPVFKYGSKATATDLLHHVVYATATGLAYSYLDRSQSRPG